MKRKRFWLLAVMALVIAAAGFLVAPRAQFAQSKKSVKKEARFSKVGKKTKVDLMHATPGDTLTWSDPASDLYFYFMDATLLGVETQTLKKGSTLNLMVQSAAKNGTYNYAIFRLADSTFVIGNTPPTIIIP